MKYVLIIVALFLSACASTVTQPEDQAPPTTLPPIVVTPPNHEEPFFIDDEGLKRGGVRLAGEKYTIISASNRVSPLPPPAPACATTPVIGAECSASMQACDVGELRYSCAKRKTYKVFGWVYEKHLPGNTYTPKAGVKFDQFWFSGCLVGICDPQAGPVESDIYGYFEYLTSSLLDTVRMYAPEGYYGNVCNKGVPVKAPAGGSYLPKEGENFKGQAFKVLKVTENSCR